MMSPFEYRPFRNSDLPRILEVWRSQPPLRGRVQAMSSSTLERYILAKPYFDPHGFIVIEEHGQLIGFVHAGFGGNSADRLDRELGSISMLQVSPHEKQDEIAAQLLTRAEAYLKLQGAKAIYGGEIHPVNPFYLGLYGGSELPGVLASDQATLSTFRAAEYEEIERAVLLELVLANFRPIIDRKMIQVRRSYSVEATFDPKPKNWWEACCYANSDRTRFVLRQPREDRPSCSLTFWDMEPLASSWAMHAVGMVDLATEEECRRQGLATFLICEALKQLQGYGVTSCHVQAMQHNLPALGLYQKLGFVEVDQGITLRKPC